MKNKCKLSIAKNIKKRFFLLINNAIFAPTFSGCSVARLSRLVWDQEVAGSNPATPTKRDFLKKKSLFLYILSTFSTIIISYSQITTSNDFDNYFSL